MSEAAGSCGGPRAAEAGAASPLGDLVRDLRILVSCGAGGVGKTTVAAALALAGARAGRRVLVLTIDPSKRLAETLGVAPHLPEPVALPEDVQRAAGISGTGSLDAWMLDPKRVSDQTVYRIVQDRKEADRLVGNKVYQQVTQMIAGMQEYTAMEALHTFVQSGRYDLVVLDTPPSRNALSFLDGPSRLERFFESRIFQLFLPKDVGFFRGAATKLLNRVLAGIFGEGPFRDLQTFFQLFSTVLPMLTGNAKLMRERMRKADAAFLLVTSPARAAIDDAMFFRDRIRDLHLPLAGFVLNRSRALLATRPGPTTDLLPTDPSAEDRSALRKLQLLARREREEAQRDLDILGELKAQAGDGVRAIAAPLFPGGIDDIEALAELSHFLAG